MNLINQIEKKIQEKSPDFEEDYEYFIKSLDNYNREFYAPSSQMYLGAVLQNNGDEVIILDLKAMMPEDTKDPTSFYEKILLRTVNDFLPDLIGISCLFSGNFPDLLKLSTFLKKYHKDIPIVIGGIHPTIYAEKILRDCPSIDYVIIAEGEESTVQMVNKIKDGSFAFEKIDGFAYRRNGEVFVNKKTKFIQNLDSLPFR